MGDQPAPLRPSRDIAAATLAMFALSFNLILFELLLTRLFAVVLFAQFAHLALALALLGIGIGAIAQHLWPHLLPEQGLTRRLGWLALLQGLATLLAIVCIVYFPLTVQFDTPISGLTERTGRRDELLDPLWFGLLLPVLATPFAVGGLAFSGVFFRLRRAIGRLYGADLLGGAAGGIVFLPVLAWLAGPDTSFLITAACSVVAALLFRESRARGPAILAVALALVSVALVCVGALGHEILSVRYAAGYPEKNVRYSRWTPLARLSIHRDQYGDSMLLDNTSASQIVLSESNVLHLTRMTNRALVYQLHQPPARVAVLAASAGPEVAVAQHYGFREIEAIDIAGEIFRIVAERYPDNKWNPYRQPGVVQVQSDGRAAILHAKKPFDIIQMVHANLWSSAGLMANAWSPALLETTEAFRTYLDQLTPDGTLSFAKGPQTDSIVRAAAQALVQRGVKDPWRYIAYVRGTVLLVKPRPWRQEERDRLVSLLGTNWRKLLWIDPLAGPQRGTRAFLLTGPALTDDRPYEETPAVLRDAFDKLFSSAVSMRQHPLLSLYRSLLIQCLFVLGAGILFVLVPLLRRGPTELAGVSRLSFGLAYVSCLGYGYLAIETVLIHELVLFVGHPTYAVTVVILAMLLFSGLASMATGRFAPERLGRTLHWVLAGVIVLGALQAWVIPGILNTFCLGLPLPVRLAITFAVLAPLGFLMGMPFPLAMRQLPGAASGMVPWAWALNGWMSVLASLATVLISRLAGFSWASGAGLAAYAGALLLARHLGRIGLPRSHAAAEGPPPEVSRPEASPTVAAPTADEAPAGAPRALLSN